MKKIYLLLSLFIVCSLTAFAQPELPRGMRIDPVLPASKVDFDAFEALTKEVKEYRKDRLLSIMDFLRFSKEKNTIILDTRSTEMYNRKHVKGAIHLDFTDFTQDNLARLIPSMNTRILIYCNNNFDNDPVYFVTKSVRPLTMPVKSKSIAVAAAKPLTLALNIPTFINLYGYGYKNVYELGDFVSVMSPVIRFEGTDVVMR